MPVRSWKIWELLALFEKYADFIPLLDLPDWANSEDVRLWLVKVLSVVETFTDGTENKIDDALVDFGQKITTDTETWQAIYSLVLDLVTGDAGSAEGDNRIKVMSDKVGIDPITIIAIIQAVVQFISWWKNRQQADLPPVENID